MMKPELPTGGAKLDQLQRWMQAVVTHPGGILSGVASQKAQDSLSVNIDTLDDVVAPSARLTSAERLAIYCRSYYARLVQCLESMFPILLRFLGNELFDKFALDYLDKHPPYSYTLDNVADAFPPHLAETRPDAAARPDQREQWPDFIIELATLELAFMKVYDGPGVEGQPLPGINDVRGITLETIFDLRPVPVPCLRLFAFRYPVHDYLFAARRGETTGMPSPRASFVAMTRRNYRIKVHELTLPQHELLSSFDGDATVAQATDRSECLADYLGTETPLVDWLADWVAKGFVILNRSRAGPG
jgi:Putative DNA-binding domain